MSTTAELKQTVLELAKEVKMGIMKGGDPEFMLAAAHSCREVAGAYAIMREVELHEEYHLTVDLPGEKISSGH